MTKKNLTFDEAFELAQKAALSWAPINPKGNSEYVRELQNAYSYGYAAALVAADEPPSEPKPCEHLRSELLAEKQTNGEPLFQMRKCLDCKLQFRVRTRSAR
mgnify:CR=1 FL=1